MHGPHAPNGDAPDVPGAACAPSMALRPPPSRLSSAGGEPCRLGDPARSATYLDGQPALQRLSMAPASSTAMLEHASSSEDMSPYCGTRRAEGRLSGLESGEPSSMDLGGAHSPTSASGAARSHAGSALAVVCVHCLVSIVIAIPALDLCPTLPNYKCITFSLHYLLFALRSLCTCWPSRRLQPHCFIRHRGQHPQLAAAGDAAVRRGWQRLWRWRTLPPAWAPGHQPLHPAAAAP